MKHTGTQGQVITDIKAKNFEIVMNSKMYSILTDKLYTNKEGAIIRELAANAYDAHVAANNAHIAFEINLPSRTKEEFSIRDFGTGIDPMVFEDTFTTLGYSTKDDTNDYVGLFGLGSKTPFTLVDTYLIHNYWNGMEYVYAAFKEEGMPKISLTASKESNEPNGLKISFACNRYKQNTFIQECTNQLKYYKIKPIVKNDLGIVNIQYGEDIDLSKGWCVTNQGSYENKLVVVMGNIGYRVPFDDLKRNTTSKYYCLNNSMRLSVFVYLKAKIGEIDIIPSREGIELTERSIKFLDDNLDKVVLNLKADVSRKLYNCITAKEIMTAIHPFSANFLRSIGMVRTGIGVLSLCDFPLELTSVRGSYANTSNIPKNTTRTDLHKAKEIFVNDIGKGGKKAVLDLKETQGKPIEGIFVTEAYKKEEVKKKSKIQEEELKKLGYEYTLISSFYVKPKRAKTVNRKIPNQMFKVSENGNRYPVNELPDSGYYTLVKYDQLTDLSYAEACIYKHYCREKNLDYYHFRIQAYKIAMKEKELKNVKELYPHILGWVETHKNKLLITQKLHKLIDESFKDRRIFGYLKQMEWKDPYMKKFFAWATQKLVENASFNGDVGLHSNTFFKIKDYRYKEPELKLPENIVRTAKVVKENYSTLMEYLNVYRWDHAAVKQLHSVMEVSYKDYYRKLYHSDRG